jgi:hypothetical protein
MNPAAVPTPWPPAPAPPWVNRPIIHESASGSTVLVFIIIIAVVVSAVFLLLFIVFKRSGRLAFACRSDRQIELVIRRELQAIIGQDVRWLTAAELEKIQLKSHAHPDEFRSLLAQLSALERKRFGR